MSFARRGSPRVLLLFAAGLMQMAGEIAGCGPLRGLGAASALAPAPKVFSSVNGLETFTSRFVVEWTDAAGAVRAVVIDPSRSERIRAPYARRNVFGAALAYGPVLAADPRTRALSEAIMRASLCGDAALLRELGIDADPRSVGIRVIPRPGTDPSHLPLAFHGSCR